MTPSDPLRILEQTPPELQRVYRFGWLPLIGGCALIVAAVFAVWDLLLDERGVTVDDTVNELLRGRATVSAALVTVYVGGFVWMLRNRLERARAQLFQTYVKMQQDRMRADQSAGLAALSRILAHEIRNPLNAMTLQCRLLERAVAKLPDPGRGEVEGHARVLKSEAQRLDNLVEDYLKQTRSEPPVMRVREMLLDDLLREMIALNAPVLELRNMTIELVCEGHHRLNADEDRLKQVFQNLIRNSMEAMRRDGAIRIMLRSGGDRVQVVFEDNGPGFDDPGAVFRPFYTTKAQGHGLGMAVVRDIVVGHGGQLRAENLSSGGARITMELPCGDAG